MLMRSALLACATVASVVAQPAAAEAPRCDAMNVRVYFDHGSAALDAAGRELLDTAARHMTACGDYSEIHVLVDGASATSRARGAAVLAATRGNDWDVARAEPVMAHRIAMSAGPDFVEVVMTPYPMPALPMERDAPEAGV